MCTQFLDFLKDINDLNNVSNIVCTEPYSNQYSTHICVKFNINLQKI